MQQRGEVKVRTRLGSTVLSSAALVVTVLVYNQACFADDAGPVAVEELRCEYLVNPLGIDTVRPRFSWILMSDLRGQKQTAYRIIVASSESQLNPGGADKWDSGKVESDRSVNIVYNGKGLSSGEQCSWQVRAWDKDGKASHWSKPAHFEMGLLEEGDWQGKWIRKDRSTKDEHYVSGRRGTGITLNGASETIRIEHYPQLKPAKAITISAWVKPDEGISDRETNRWWEIYRKDDRSLPQLVTLGKVGDFEGVWFGLPINSNYTEDAAALPLATLKDGKWHLITATYDGSFKKIYADGEEIGSVEVRGSIDTAGSLPAFIGSYQGDKELFSGGIDDVRVYEAALSGAQVKRLARGDDFSDALVGHWPLDGDLANRVEGNDGKLIGATSLTPAPIMRKDFQISGKVKRARVYMSGLGWSELYINGMKVGDRVLDPASTVYNQDQPFMLHSRVLYTTHDATNYLKNGKNAMGVMLGNGWWSSDGDSPAREPFAEEPIVLLQMNIEYDSGEVVSFVTDESWKVADGPITYNDICHGEDYDARREKIGWRRADYDDSGWDDARPAAAPTGKMVSQTLEPVKVIKTIKPVKIKKLSEGVYVYDFGQHFSGWTRLRVSGPKGTTITIRHAGVAYRDGTLDTRNQDPVRQTDSYILKGDGIEVWEPRFTLHGFRYAEINGFPGEATIESLEGRFVRNAIDIAGSFECSNPLLNQIHRNVVWTFMASLQGIPQDAADRNERIGWLGDTGFVAEDYMMNFDDVVFWSKWLDDIKDSQIASGAVPVIAPLNWRQGLGESYMKWPCWMATYPLITWYVYQYYDDERVLREHYDGLAALVDYHDTLAEDYIISGGIGDHMEPDRSKGSGNHFPLYTPQVMTSTAYYYYDAWILAQIAQVLDKEEGYRKYSTLATNIKEALNERLLNKETNQYATGSQTSNALALHLGLVPENRKQAVLQNLVDEIMVTHQGHLSTGIVGANALEQVLGKMGRADVMFEIATQTTYPSWGDTIARGATTVWETFQGVSSRNMKMFGSTEKFFYKDLGGIDKASPGFKKIRIKPNVVGDLNYVKASLKTVNGLVAVDWKKSDKRFEMKVAIPVNTTAEISVPTMGLGKMLVTESNVLVFGRTRFAPGAAGIHSGRIGGGYVTFEVGSGDYSFLLTGEEQTTSEAKQLWPIPDKLVVLTFDDRAKSWRTFVGPLLKKYGFGGTFFVTDADWFDYYEKDDYWITWDEIRQLHEMGFEIGNHTGNHGILPALSVEQIIEELEIIERLCEANGIPKPVTMGVPNGPHDIKCVQALERKGYLFGRRGVSPEGGDTLDSYHGPAYDPQEDSPHLVPSTLLWYSPFSADSTSGRLIYGYAYDKGSTFEDFKKAAKRARNGKIAVLTFHGVPDYYSHCSIPQKMFAICMKYLHDEDYTVVALRDLAKYVDTDNRPEDPYEPIRRRMKRMEAATASVEQ